MSDLQERTRASSDMEQTLQKVPIIVWGRLNLYRHRKEDAMAANLS